MNLTSSHYQSVAIAGAGGFIGSAVSLELNRNGILVRNGYRSEKGRLSAENAFRLDIARRSIDPGFLQNAHVLVHAAGPAHVSVLNERQFRADTLDGGRWLFERAIAAGVRRIVLVSSCKAGYEFGQNVSEVNVDEPKDVYGKVKLELEQVLVSLAEPAGVEWVIFRPALVYGVGVKGNLAAWLMRARNPLLPRLPSAGYRSMVSATDLARAIRLGCNHPSAAKCRFYVSDGIDYSVSAIDAAIRAELGLRFPPIQVQWLWKLLARLGDVAALSGVDIGFDSARFAKFTTTATCSAGFLRAQLGWQPRETFFQLLPSMLLSQLSMETPKV